MNRDKMSIYGAEKVKKKITKIALRIDFTGTCNGGKRIKNLYIYLGSLLDWSLYLPRAYHRTIRLLEIFAK